MNIILGVCVFLVVLFLAYLTLYYKSKATKLISAVIAADQLKEDLTETQKHITKEFDFISTQTIGFVSDIASKLYSKEIVVQGFSINDVASVGAIADVLNKIPQNHLSRSICSSPDGVSKGTAGSISSLLEICPSLAGIAYVELITVVRIMVLDKVDLAKAVEKIKSV